MQTTLYGMAQCYQTGTIIKQQLNGNKMDIINNIKQFFGSKQDSAEIVRLARFTKNRQKYKTDCSTYATDR